MVYLRNIFIISFLFIAFAVAIFENQMVPYLDIKKYDKSLFGFEHNFSPRWVPFFPFASMPMYSDNFDPGLFTDIEVVGEDVFGNQFFLEIKSHFYPAWSDAFREVYSNQIYHGMSKKEFASHIFLLFLKRRDSFDKSLMSIQKLKIVSVTWNFETWLKMRKEVEDIHRWYDWRQTEYKPMEENVLVEITQVEALKYALK
ncbi:MAG: hypothetical protein MK008_08175 [Bdellovibrionales bacterium]|nr:hypothetical protein [Bdellovibrionales bacterium]